MLVLPDDIAKEDLIGHADYRDGLVKMIQSVESRGSFTIGVYGQWGSGKSSMLKQIKNSLNNNKSDDSPLVTVWFNPWQFVSEEHLIIPFFHTLIATLQKEAKESTIKSITDKLSVFLEKVVNVPLALLYGMEGDFKIPLLLKAKFSFSKMMDQQEEKEAAIDKKAAEKYETAMQAAAQEYESTYYNLLQILQDAAADLDVKIVVFIDDLDRCLPEKAVELLEGLKVLLDLKNFIFVMGVAQEVIERGIRVRYKDLYITNQKDDVSNIEDEYLDKIIQFPFTLPAANSENLKDNILSKHLIDLKIAEPFIDMILEALGNNPRTLKRFINTISFSQHIIEKQQDNHFEPELLIKMSLIGYLFPILYRQLEKYPSHLLKLEEIVGAIEKRNRKKEDSKDDYIEGQAHDIHELETGLPIIDQWLETNKLNKLLPVLKIQDVGGDNLEDLKTNGFRSRETVEKYLSLTATSIQSETTSKANDSSRLNKSLAEQMRGRMVKIPGGTFLMGEEDKQVEVTISRSFKLDKYPVTQDLYEQVMHSNPSHFKGEDRPVEVVSWFNAVRFCNTLSIQLGLEEVYEIEGELVKVNLESNGYRLPTEAEWEYACRAGTTGDRHGELDDIAWYRENSEDTTQGVGQKQQNDFGLYDMLGNVWEWCYDWHGDYPIGPLTDPQGADAGSSRVMRGGSWGSLGRFVRSAYRALNSPAGGYHVIGFRLLLGH